MEDNDINNKETQNKDSGISTINTSTTTNKSSETDSKIDNKENDIEIFIEKISLKLSVLYKLYISGKILYYFQEEGDIIYFVIEICKDTDINPFEANFIIDLQFIPKKKPLINFRKDCFIPSLCDNRNFFDCFVKNDFIYDNNLTKLEKIMEEIIHDGIKNFLYCLKENIEYNTFVYYGDYELKELYNINDFLQNSDLIKFYRVNHIYNSEIEEKYFIITQLYFLILIPKKDDKSFAELIFKEKLREININLKKTFNNKFKKDTILLIFEEINTPIDNTYEMEFFFIDRSCPININDIYQEENDNNNNEINKINNEPQNEEKIFMEKYDKLKDDINIKQKEINLSKYISVISTYKPLFKSKMKETKNLSEIEIKNRIIDYEKLFQFCEKNFEHYNNLEGKEKEKYKDRIQFYLIVINFLAAELMAFYDKEKTNFNYYYNKIKSILNENEKNQ
jgi:hypothetical protein